MSKSYEEYLSQAGNVHLAYYLKAADILNWQAKTGYQEPRLNELLQPIRAALPRQQPAQSSK